MEYVAAALIGYVLGSIPVSLLVARRHGVDLPKVPPRRLGAVADSDFVVTVCDNAHEELPALRATHWSVPDPLRINTEEAFEYAFNDISRRISDLAPRLHAA